MYTCKLDDVRLENKVEPTNLYIISVTTCLPTVVVAFRTGMLNFTTSADILCT